MNRTQQIFSIVLLVLAFCVVPIVGCAPDKSNRDDVAANTADVQIREADKEEATKAESSDSASGKAESGHEESAKDGVVPITIGSAAPQLDIEHWIQDGEGQFAKVTEFEQDKVYIVEFWATWCGPCIAAMPHIAQLQQSYADRGVQVVSITREDVETVEKFLDRTVRNADEDAEPKTYRDLTSSYCLTADPDESSSRDYMRAAKRNGIPCAFIVGKDARIEWIGHPMTIDEPLEKIVTDSWNRDEFAQEYVAEQETNEVLSNVSSLMRRKKTEEAIAVLDDYIDNGKLDSQKARFRTIKFQVLVGDKERADEASEYALELLADESLDATSVNNISWTIYQLAKTDRLQGDELLKAALDVSQKRAVDEAGKMKPFLLDTVAHLQHQLGDREAALETQRSAIESADPANKQRMASFLDELEREIKADEKKPKEEEPKDSDKDDNKSTSP